MDILPDDATPSDVLEWAARKIEETSITEFAGIFAKKKRVREDAELSGRVARQERKDMARVLRAFKQHNRNDALTVLAEIAEDIEGRDKHNHVLHLRNAWPLAWKGWLNIWCKTRCNSNQIPPETSYVIELTEAGRAAIASLRASADKGGGNG